MLISIRRIKKTIVALTLIFTTCVYGFSQTTATQDYRQEWQKMNASKQTAIEEFKDSKFGLFIHWGLCSIPAVIWKGVPMEESKNHKHIAEWIQYSFEIPRAEYAELAKEFNPTAFDADAIARLAKDAGMKFIVFTSKHHDGFAMFDSKCSSYNIVDATPYHKDVVEALYKACQKYGLGFGLYYSQNIDWGEGGDCGYAAEKLRRKATGPDKFEAANTWDPSPNTFEDYIDNKGIPQVKELFTMCPNINQLWYDVPKYLTPEQSFRFYKAAYDMQPKALINSRVGNGFGDFEVAGDNQILDKTKTTPWQTVGTLNNSWGSKSYDNDWHSPKELIYWLVDIVSKGGNYLLNIGPRGDGSVPEQSVKDLTTIGKWLRINGEGIYATKPWTINHEGPYDGKVKGTDSREKDGFNGNFSNEDFWFTTKGNSIYVFCLQPLAREIVSRSFAGAKISSVRLLGDKHCLKCDSKTDGLHISLPRHLPSDFGFALKIN